MWKKGGNKYIKMRVKFCGAVQSVTGSCHLITIDNHKILLDCGQFQGGKQQEALNFMDFPFDPEEIEAVVLSHAHIDHCGRIPLLAKRGFRGNIYCTDATADLLEIMLRDSGYIHEKEAEWKNRKNERVGIPLIEPLYTVKEAEESLKLVRPVLYDQLFEINESMKACFNDAGHILGSAITELWVTEGENTSKLVFSGDLGVKDRPILRDPTVIKKADFLIMESTYGNRLHPKEEGNIEALMEIVEATAKRGGTVVIPSFAVGRTQELIYDLAKIYKTDGKYKELLDNLKVYIDSPMATNATEIFKNNAQVFDEEAREFLMSGTNPLDFGSLEFTKSTEESQILNEKKEPKIIISASGMCEAGRIRHHLKHNLWDSRNSIVFVGYQAEGTLGRRLIEGAEEVVLFGEVIKVQAQIHNLQGFSGHADRDGLFGWLSSFIRRPEQIFLVHGEKEAKEDFAAYVKENLSLNINVVEDISEFDLEASKKISIEQAIAHEQDEEFLDEIKAKIARVHNEMEQILYDANLHLGESKNPDVISEINNKILDIEKGVVGISSILTQKSDE